MIEYKKEYDFLHWTSFPSSLKFWDIRARSGIAIWSDWSPPISVMPGQRVRIEFYAKQENVQYSTSRAETYGYVSETGEWRPVYRYWVAIPRRTIPYFQKFSSSDVHPDNVVPPDVTAIRVRVGGGSGSPEAPGITWFDDLRIYLNDELIYEEYFSASPIHNIIPTAPRPEEHVTRFVEPIRKKLGLPSIPSPRR